MYTLTVLQANVAAANDQTKLSAADMGALREYAEATCSGYCAGCREICDAAMGNSVPVADVMRFLMYHNSYESIPHVRQILSELPKNLREQLARLDFSPAEQACPRGLKIASLMKEASDLLA